MSLAYRIMYGLGVTPWEHERPQALIDLVDELPAGDMLDIGCGTAGDAIYCAQRGWTVTGVDSVRKALATARRNAENAGQTITFMQKDVSRPVDLGGPYSLLLDGGCLHGLPPAAFRQAAQNVDAAATSGATLLMFAFSPGRRGLLPRGVDAAEVAAAFPAWDLHSRPVDERDLPSGPARQAAPYWHQLVKH